MEKIKHTPMGTTSEHIPDEIFAIWISKPGTYMMPFLYEVCIASWQILNPSMKMVLYVSNPEIKFNLLSRDTTEVRILDEEFPGIIKEAEDIIGNQVSGMKFAHISDYIRYVILRENRGIYVDCDLVCISTIEELVQQMRNNNKSILMAYEDTMRICNAFMANLDEDGTTGCNFYNDIVNLYRENYIPTSYTFNSIKYPMILARKYKDFVNILPFKEGMFYPNWEKNENGDLKVLLDTECNLAGYGVHLYNTDPKWQEFRRYLDEYMYTGKSESWFVKHLDSIIDAYIVKMKDSTLRDITKDKVLVKNLTELYGEEYVDQFRKEN